jgi:alpha-tubulin suppressor-like RCC1 family protein
MNVFSKYKNEATLRKHWQLIFVLFFFAALIAIVPFSYVSTVLSATYTWTQSSWSGGATINVPSHPGNQSDWTEFASKDAQIDTTSSSTAVQLLANVGSSTDDTDDDFSTGTFSAATSTNDILTLEFIQQGDSWQQVDDPILPNTHGYTNTRLALLYPGSGDYLYMSNGDTGTPNFARYSISTDQWEALASTPATTNTALGRDITYPGTGDYIYMQEGRRSDSNDHTRIWAYSITNGDWTTFDPQDLPTTGLFHDGVAGGDGTLESGGNGYLYSYMGDNNTVASTSKYSIVGDSWAFVPNATKPNPDSFGESVATTDYIYYINRGDDFDAFSITNEDWTTFDPTDPGLPDALNPLLAYPKSGDTIYYSIGSDYDGNTCTINTYSISGDTWTTDYTTLNEGCGPQSSMEVTDDYIFVKAADYSAGWPIYTDHFWRYAFNDSYQSSGTYTSATKDAGQGVDFTNLGFSGTTLSDTDGTYLANVAHISSGSHRQSCAITDSGNTYCWGYGGNGRLGNDSSDNQETPVRVVAGEASGVDSDGTYLKNAASVSTGGIHTCASMQSGNTYCWGYNNYLALGADDEITPASRVPVQVHDGEASGADSDGEHLTNISKVVVGRYHACAVANSGYVYCWGAGADGQLGHGLTPTSQGTPVQVLAGQATGADSDGVHLQNIVDISAGEYQTCAVSSAGNVYCWGRGDYGRLGHGSQSDTSTPVQVVEGEATGADSDGAHLTNVKNVSTINRHTCASTNSGNMYCWGVNTSGILGNGNSSQQYSPVQVLAGAATEEDSDGTHLVNVTNISTGYYNSCASTASGNMYCWGQANYGRLGDGQDSTNHSSPVRVLAGEATGADSDGVYLQSVDSITSGTGHVCANTSNGNLYCWGRGNEGQLGNDQFGNIFTPVKVQDGEATNINTLRFQLRSADSEANLSAATWYGPTGTGDYYTSSGQEINSVHDGDQWFQYQILLDTTDTSLTPSVDSVSVNYQYYSASSTLTSSPYNTNDSFNTLSSIAWSETLPANTDIQFQIRTASTSAGLSSADWYGPTGTSSYFTDASGGDPLPATLADGTEDQWMQYKAILSTSDGLDTPILSDVTLTYVVNGTPIVDGVLNDGGGALDQDDDGIIRLQYNTRDIDNTDVESYFFYDIGVTLADEGGVLSVLDTTDIIVSNSQNLPAAGTIMIDREIIEYTTNDTASSTLSGISRGQWPGNPAWDSTVAQHSNGAAIYLLAETVSGEGAQSVTAATSTFTGVMYPATDVPGVYLSDATVAVAVSDGELANMVGVSTSSAFTLDTTPPSGGALLYDSINDQLTISVNDDSPVAMKLSNNSNLSSDGVNGDSGSWIAYGTDGNVDGYGDTPLQVSVNKSWVGSNNDVETIYVRFQDNKGNLSATTSIDTPRTPGNFIYRDVSNVDIDDYKLFVAWGVVPNPTPGFLHYRVYRSENGGAFTLFKTITDRTENYFIDSGLSTTTEYAYKIYAADNDGNTSNYSVTVTDTPNGQGGSDLTPPTITSVTATNLVPQGVEISWTTDELANSTVGYSVDTGYATEEGSPTMTTDHSVILSNLTPNTTYNFRVKSEDPNANTSNWSTGYQFTTPPGPAISNVTVPEVTSATAKISWITDTISDSYVVYSTNANMASSTQVGSATLVNNHVVTLTGLTEGETYYYYVKSTDATMNESSDTNAGEYYSFVTQIDNAGPVISSVTVATVSNTQATVTWTTDENSTSQLFYGETTSYGSSSTIDSALSVRHSVTISGLTPETTYYFKVSSTDVGGNNTEDDNSGVGYDLTTTDDPGITQIIESDPPPVVTDTAPPNAVNIAVTNIGSTTATINWTTSERGNSLVAYGVTTNYDNIAGNYTTFTSPTNSHTVSLRHLTPATQYHLRAISQDAAGNIGMSDDIVFATLDEDGTEVIITQPDETTDGEDAVDPELPGLESDITDAQESVLSTLSEASDAFITALLKALPGNNNLDKISEDAFVDTVSEIAPKIVSSPDIASQDLTVEVGPTWAEFSWVTNKRANSIAALSPDDGFTGEYTRKEGDPETLTTDHFVRIEGLEPQQVYHYSVQSKAPLGDWAKSPDATFTTTSLLSEIADLAFTKIGTDSVILSWETTLPTRTNIEVTDTVTGEVFTYDDASLLKKHVVELGDLNLSTSYVLQVVAEDEDGNVSSSSVLPFTTQASLVPAVIDQVRTSTSLVPGQIERVQTIISWKTDKPATSRILFEEGVSASTELAQSTPLQTNLVKDHIVVTTQFQPGKVYRFRIESIDGLGNRSVSKDYTILTPAPEENVLDLILDNFEDSFGFLKQISF